MNTICFRNNAPILTFKELHKKFCKVCTSDQPFLKTLSNFLNGKLLKNLVKTDTYDVLLYYGNFL